MTCLRLRATGPMHSPKPIKIQRKNKLLWKTGDMGSFIKWYCKQIGKSKLVKADLEGPASKLVRPFHKNNIFLQFQMEECHLLLTDQIDLVNPEGNGVVPDVSKPLPLGGPPGDKERRNALSISKLKAAYYQDFGLEELVPSLWIESEREYDISAAYGISHWWFKRKEFYITRHSAPFDCHAVRSHMKILSVVSLKTFSRYGYTFLREIVLRRADYKEYKISEANFKNLHPNDFEDLYLLHLQGKLNHLFGVYKVHQFNTISLWIRNIVIRQQDYTIVHKPRAVIYKDKTNQKKMMRETEVHKFRDGTLTRILEKLDHMVKDYVLFKFNPGMEHIIWSEDDKRRSKEFIEVIERRLTIRIIFRSLESSVSGSQNQRDLPRDNPLVSVEVLRFTHFYRLSHSELVDIEKVAVSTSLRSLKPKRTIKSRAKRSSINLIRTLFQLILSIHSEDGNPARANIKQALVAAGSRRQVRFITTCSYLTGTSKDFMKAKVYVSKLPYEHVGPEVIRSQDDERPQDDDWRLHLADDLKEAQDHNTQVELMNKLKIKDQISLHQSTRYQMKNQRLRAGTQEQSYDC
ncbi:hypothetical protein Tco_0399726 [Tanacetum coccineum]